MSNERIYKLLSNVIRRNETKSAIEFGCGKGYWIKIIDSMGVQDICGIDGSKNMIDIAKKKFLKIMFILY